MATRAENYTSYTPFKHTGQPTPTSPEVGSYFVSGPDALAALTNDAAQRHAEIIKRLRVYSGQVPATEAVETPKTPEVTERVGWLTRVKRRLGQFSQWASGRLPTEPSYRLPNGELTSDRETYKRQEELAVRQPGAAPEVVIEVRDAGSTDAKPGYVPLTQQWEARVDNQIMRVEALMHAARAAQEEDILERV
jgi:hypothetical protein